MATNEPPYSGVRGRAVASITPIGAAELLEKLATRYLGSDESPFRSWLRKRAADEVCIRIDPTWLTSWDYRDRMNA